MTNLQDYKNMLQASVNGLKQDGWWESGGSDVWRMLSKNDVNIKVFLNSNVPGESYINPTSIIIRKT